MRPRTQCTRPRSDKTAQRTNGQTIRCGVETPRGVLSAGKSTDRANSNEEIGAQLKKRATTKVGGPRMARRDPKGSEGKAGGRTMAWRRNARRAQATGTGAGTIGATESWTEWVDRLAEDLDVDADEVEVIAENAGSDRDRDELEEAVRQAMATRNAPTTPHNAAETAPIVVGSE